MVTCSLPFRWDVRRRAQLGRLLRGETVYAYPLFEDDLLDACARVLGASGDGELVFVGRSPESVFDHLTGLLAETSWGDRLKLVPLSVRADWDEPREALVRAHLTARGLDPARIVARRRRTTFCDLVCNGATFGALVGIYRRWSRDWAALRSKVRFVCLLSRANDWWRSDAEWLDLFPRRAVRPVKVPVRLWSFLGDQQPKTTPSFHPERWDDPAVERPPRELHYLRALRFARAVFELGRSRVRRAALVDRLVELPAMRERWFRSLVRELRRA